MTDMLSPTETIVGEIWAELLHPEKINLEDDFFELGGDSMKILAMLARLADVAGVKLSPVALMDAPTLGEFCRIIDMKKSEALNAEVSEIVPCACNDRLPVSFIQEQIVRAELANLYDPEKTRSHCLDLCYRIEGAIDVPTLNKALSEIVRRHEILRTSYSVKDGTIYQNVNAAPQTILRVEDLCSLPRGDRERETERILKEIATDSFSFFRDKLMIAATLITSGTEHVLAVVVNHIAMDGLSMDILRNELFMLYKAFSRREPSPLANLPIQYADFALWEREHFSGDRLEAKLAWWRGLACKSLDTALPTDHKPTTISYAGDIVPVSISPEQSRQLRQLARKCKVTLFTVLFSAFVSLIHVFSRYRYNFFCIPVANRTRRETQSLIGCFMNFQFVPIDLSGNPTLLEIIERFNRTLHDVYENYVPFHFVTQQIPPQGPVVDFQLLPAPDDGVMYPEGLRFFPFRLQPQEFALFPIDVRLVDYSEAITGHFKYQTALYDGKTIQDMVDDYVNLLTEIAREPDIRLNDILRGELNNSIMSGDGNDDGREGMDHPRIY